MLKKLVKKRGNLKWTFENDRQRFLTHMLRIRIGNRAIAKRTGFTVGEITYAARRYKDSAGLNMSLRQRWAAGLDPLVDQMLYDRAIVEAMDAEIDRKVIPVIMHPTPKTVRIKD